MQSFQIQDQEDQYLLARDRARDRQWADRLTIMSLLHGARLP